MKSSPKPTDPSEQNNPGTRYDWEPQAWVYLIWIVMGNRVYCKIGYSTNPASRYSQIITGMPERPFQMHLLYCLNPKQAQLFEAMLHEHLKDYRARGEWFTHPNVKHLNKALGSKVQEIFDLFRTFGYEPYLEQLDLDGYRPVLYKNGYVSHLSDPSARGDGEGE